MAHEELAALETLVLEIDKLGMSAKELKKQERAEIGQRAARRP
jgi:hypothetical protein